MTRACRLTCSVFVFVLCFPVWSLWFSAVCGLLFPMNTNVLQTLEINPPPFPLNPSLPHLPPSLPPPLPMPSLATVSIHISTLFTFQLSLFHLTFCHSSFPPPQSHPSLPTSEEDPVFHLHRFTSVHFTSSASSSLTKVSGPLHFTVHVTSCLFRPLTKHLFLSSFPYSSPPSLSFPVPFFIP